MRAWVSTVAGTFTLLVCLVIVALVVWSSAECQDRIRAHESAGTIEAEAADELIRSACLSSTIIGVIAFCAALGLGAIATRGELRLRETSSSLNETAGELQDLSLARTTFLAMMSHELRTPLNSIIGFSGILNSGMAGDLTVEQRKQVGIINSAGKQLLALINDILDLSKLETGKLVLVAEEFRVTAAVDAVIDTLRPLAEERGLELRVRIPDPGLTMCTDRRRLEQVLLSIVSRSVKLTESGHVLTEVGRAADGDIMITVSDTSAGMTDEEIGGLFEEPQDLEPRPGRSRSTGFALMVSRRLSRALGGDISVESEPGLGSVFTLTLPEVVDDELCMRETSL